jgi:hypothetical protein
MYGMVDSNLATCDTRMRQTAGFVEMHTSYCGQPLAC